jgi:hypothetical protein
MDIRLNSTKAGARKKAGTESAPTTPPRPRGRPAGDPGLRAVVGSIRLTAEDWKRFHELGGVAWLRERIHKARGKRGVK